MINDFITHLQTQLVTGGDYDTVRHSWDIEPFDVSAGSNTPAGLVFMGREVSSESNADNRVDQRTNREVWVYTICEHADLDSLRAQLFAAALGYQAAAIWNPLEHERGEVRKLSGNLVWWLDVFQTWRMNEQA